MPQRSQGPWLIAVTILAVCAAIAALVLLYLQMHGGGISTVSGQDQRHPPQFSHMQLQSQYAGPIAGTVIQRWRDPIDGTICYIYLPMIVHHKPAPSGYVEYGSQSIGSISCMPGSAAK
jgi:hypothetical protein